VEQMGFEENWNSHTRREFMGGAAKLFAGVMGLTILPPAPEAVKRIIEPSGTFVKTWVRSLEGIWYPYEVQEIGPVPLLRNGVRHAIQVQGLYRTQHVESMSIDGVKIRYGHIQSTMDLPLITMGPGDDLNLTWSLDPRNWNDALTIQSM
jgi:hypothetical protein